MKSRIVAVAAFVAYLGLAGAAMAAAGAVAWWCELATHWAHVLGALLAASGATLLFARRYALGATATAAGIGLLAFVGVAFLPRGPASDSGPGAGPEVRRAADGGPGAGAPLKIVVANVGWFNDDAARVLPFLATEDPDVAVVLETTARHHAALAPLAARLPHMARAEAEHEAGSLAVRSRFPFVAAEPFRPDGPLPQLQCDFDGPSGRVRLFALHAFPPISAAAAGFNRAVLDETARRAAAARGAGLRVVVAGDLNLAPWSFSFRRFGRASGLDSTRRGAAFAATWPEWALFPAVAIPIDHVLVAGFDSEGLKASPWIGSDHRALSVRLLPR